MSNFSNFSVGLKRAVTRNKEQRTKKISNISISTKATKTKLTDDQYRNIILATSMAYLQQKGVV